ncbi:MAG TPA: NAD+ synthase [Desulfotomaculum sp.]|nr:MAG: NH(3)-dependent NAD(+) synthetase [Desulfotomaculum sp. 46_296]HAG11617.1 NAD+ synthase [Desulfotomaculum sp.]HBY04769.1 NAD+ synthase [Desulfotomaculum sp.]
MKIALAQLNPTIGNIKHNAAKISRIIKICRNKNVDLAIFPELALTGYPPRDLLFREDFLKEVEFALDKYIIPYSDEVAIIVGAPIRENGDLYNSALLYTHGSLAGRQDKTLLPDYDVFDESRYFKSGDNHKPVLFKGVKFGLTVCEDVWNDKDYWNRHLYPIDPVEKLIEEEADLIINISASPYHYSKINLRLDMLQKMAQKYGKPFIYVNQIGGNDELIFDGTSFAVNSSGTVAHRAGSFCEDLIFLEYENNNIEAGNLHITGENIFPGSRKYYSPLPEDIGNVYYALVLGIRDYLSKTGFTKAVVGLSGGIDSSVTAVLAADALGKDNVLGVAMPTSYSSTGSLTDARGLAKNLGISYREIPIQSLFADYLNFLNEEGACLSDLAEENLQARIRGNILMFISNREGYLTLSTGNKSELAVGYCTLYGDMSGGLAVISDLPKTMVYKLASFINRNQEIIPADVLTKPPSAELKPGQVDQDSLPPYDALDEILQTYIEQDKTADEIVALGYDPSVVREIIRKVNKSEFKRKQAAPGLKITSRAFGMGRRMPTAWQKSY